MFPSFAVCPEGRLLSISLRADMGLPDGEDLRCGRPKAPLPPLSPATSVGSCGQTDVRTRGSEGLNLSYQLRLHRLCTAEPSFNENPRKSTTVLGTRKVVSYSTATFFVARET